MSSYPDAFQLQSVGNLQNNTNVPTKPIILENNKMVPLKNSTENQETTTTHTQEFGDINNVDQDNGVDFAIGNNHSWSNVRGYGNIVVGTNDSRNNIHGRVHPYNRIASLKNPHDTLVDTSMAWDVNQIKYDRCK
tara:strand:- start:4283 stop:4687 length:405 start_codon:yes stop_codon:yes gene_type:complete